MRLHSRLVPMLLAAASAAACVEVLAADVDYARDVRPLLTSKCGSCHGALRQEAGLRLDAGRLIHAGSAEGPVLGGTAADSRLFARVSAVDLADRMPPEGEGEPLTAAEIETLQRWIESGAPFPEDEAVPAGPDEHWAYQIPHKAPVPAVAGGGPAVNPVDAFLAGSQQAAGVTPLGPADPATLLRRVTLDLTGLPPTREELHEFLSDPSPAAYEALVDRLLASPRYAERWARHWMDVWRYSDWDGYGKELRGSQRHMWRWRDWIIESLEADKPYDRMIAEMLAGDEIAPDDPDVLRATGFLARHHYSLNRDLWLDNAVEHTFKAFVGMTLACSKCHDHKYDPLPHTDYYAARAIFEPYRVRIDRIPGVADTTVDGLTRAYDAEPETPTYVYVRGNEKHPKTDHPLAPSVPELFHSDYLPRPVTLPRTAWFPDLREHVVEETLTSARSALDAAQSELTTAEAALQSATDADREAAALRARLARQKRDAAAAGIASLEARLAADRARTSEPPHPDALALATAAAQSERLAEQLKAELAVMVAEQALAATQAALNDDDANTKNALAQAETSLADARKVLDAARAAREKTDAAYTPFGPQYPRKSTGRRLALARWIASRDNPLTARVAVNHIWLRHFGAAFVPETFDFGLRSPAPPHQPLLDWLAVEFMEQGWRMKHIHRLIVTSAAYRRAPSGDPGLVSANAAIDPENHLYWRANTLRLDAEVVRDSVLAIGGSLDLSRGGPDIDFTEGEQVLRRSLYFRHAYEKQMRLLTLFDGANPNECYRRTTSIVPQQALALSNSPMVLAQSRRLAGRLADEVAAENDTGDGAFVSAAFETVLSRLPTADELSACIDYLASERTRLASPDQLTILETGPTIDTPPSSDPARRARENLVHVLINHTDFVTRR